MFDLVVKGGRVLDPGHGIDGYLDVAICEGRIAALSEHIPSHQAMRTVDAAGKIVAPGLIDIHVHVFWGVFQDGVLADQSCLAKGVTTVVDTGSAGATTFAGFRKFIIEASDTRIFAYLNIASQGLINSDAGELLDLKNVDVDRAVQVVQENRDVLLGIKVRLSENAAGTNDLQALKLARQAADATGVGMMIHPGNTFTPLPAILAEMKSGDILTHCFHSRRNGILGPDGRVLPEVEEAIDRGIWLDVGHGSGSFDFEVAKKALSQGVMPHTISSDLHARNINGPVFDLATTMSKLMLLGLSLEDVIERTTANPAKVLKMEETLGTLSIGACGDLTVFEIAEGDFSFVDSMGNRMTGRSKLIPALVIKEGQNLGLLL